MLEDYIKESMKLDEEISNNFAELLLSRVLLRELDEVKLSSHDRVTSVKFNDTTLIVKVITPRLDVRETDLNNYKWEFRNKLDDIGLRSKTLDCRTNQTFDSRTEIVFTFTF